MRGVTGRIEAARQRAANVKRRLGVLAAAGFVALFGLAAVSHGGTSSSASNASAVEQPAATDTETNTFDFGTADVAPSAGLAPQVQTQTS
jgi:hypothetical protein